jgi:alpha-1,3/alpha-1,6-mannosyltransferase
MLRMSLYRAKWASWLVVSIDFRPSISDSAQRELLEDCHSRTVVYTPANDHFETVPVEVVHAGTNVVAADSGGLTENGVRETTGYLCNTTP